MWPESAQWAVLFFFAVTVLAVYLAFRMRAIMVEAHKSEAETITRSNAVLEAHRARISELEKEAKEAHAETGRWRMKVLTGRSRLATLGIELKQHRVHRQIMGAFERVTETFGERAPGVLESGAPHA